MAPRATWKGEISLGFLSIPVGLYPAVKDLSPKFAMVSPDGSCRLKRKLFCPKTGKEYESSKTARGIEIGPDQYALVTEEELEKARPESGKAIRIHSFVKLAELDPIYFDRQYYLAPSGAGGRAYQLLHRAMSETGTAAIGQFVLRTKQYLALLRPLGRVICLETMHYHDEMANPGELDVPEMDLSASDSEVQTAIRLVRAMTTRFEPTAFRDQYRERVERLIESKSQGKTLELPESGESRAPKVADLGEALRRSVKTLEEKRDKKRPAA